jgi:hypothetical protein
MMARVQIALPPEDHRRARRRAGELGISVAEYVRRLVARDLGDARRQGDATGLFDLGTSGETDIGRDKDRLIGEAVASRR